MYSFSGILNSIKWVFERNFVFQEEFDTEKTTRKFDWNMDMKYC